MFIRFVKVQISCPPTTEKWKSASQLKVTLRPLHYVSVYCTCLLSTVLFSRVQSPDRQVRSTWEWLLRGEEAAVPRKEVIQPHLPVRLPCYDFTPIINPTLDACLPIEGLAQRLQVLPTFVV
jgi:hypothetical protein